MEGWNRTPARGDITPAVAAPRRSKFDPSKFRHVRDTPAGVTYLGDTPFRYRNQKGELVTVQPGERFSRRQYENLRYEAGGWHNKAEYERVIHGHLHIKDGSRRVHEADAFKRWAAIYADEHHTDVRKVLGPDSEYSQAFIAAYRDKFRDHGPDSPFAHLLVVIGLRDDSWTWDVGDTP